MGDQNKSDRDYSLVYMVTSFLLMYIFQGLFFGYLESISLLLKEKGFSFSQMSLLKFTSVPFYTKCFFSPVLDIFYSSRMGKRMTYIFSFSLISACCYFFISLNVDAWMEEKKISLLSIILIITTFTIAIQDLAIDALAEEIFVKKDLKYGPITQSIGQILGPLLSLNVFMYLHDKVVDINFKFLSILSVFTIMSTIAVFMYIREKKSESEFESVYDVIKIFPRFINHPHIRTYMLFIFTSNLPIIFFRTNNGLILLEKGFSKEDMSFLSIPSLVGGLLFSFMAGKLNLTVKSTFKYFRIFFILGVFHTASVFYLVMKFDKETNYEMTQKCLLILSFLEGIFYMNFVVLSNFSNLICDERITCTFLALMNSMNNFTRFVLTPLYTLLLDWFEYRTLGIFFIGYSFFYLMRIYPKIIRYFQMLEKKDFLLEIKVNETKAKTD